MFSEIISNNDFKELNKLKEYNESLISSEWEFNDNEYDFSIIVPVYNTEKYITKCLKSICKISSKYNLEIIVVNNGSTDNSDNKIKLIHDKRIKYYSKKYDTAASARNFGLRKAKGKYIGWVDSDDFINYHCYEKMMDLCLNDNYDFIQGGYRNYYLFMSYKYRGHESSYINDINDIFGFPWGSFILREYYKNISFPENVCYEDTLIKFKILPKISNGIFLNKNVYYFRRNMNSYTRHSELNYKGLDSLYVIIDILLSYTKEDITNTIANALFNHFKITMLRCSGFENSTKIYIKNVFLIIFEIINSLLDVNEIILKVKKYEL